MVMIPIWLRVMAGAIHPRAGYLPLYGVMDWWLYVYVEIFL
jgi:hypothetical protein